MMLKAKQYRASSEIQSVEEGQSFVEFAISLAFILILLAAIVDLGRLFFVFVTLRDAAQEGAAYASFCPADIPGIQARARASSTNPVNLFDQVNIKIEISPVCTLSPFCNTGDGISVTVKNPTFHLTMPFLGGVTVPLEATVTDTIITNAYDCPP